MLSLEFVSDFVYSNCENVSTSKDGTHFLARCPLCGDSKKNKRKRRFNLDYNGGKPIYHCFNCDSSGSFLKLYSIINCISISDAIKEFEKYDSNYIIQRLSNNRREKKVVEKMKYEDHSYILKDCISEDDKGNTVFIKNVKKMLKNFKNSRYIPEGFKVFYAYKGEYSNRIILPLYNKDGLMYYFQGRSISNSIIPKYKNPTLSKGNIIFNEHKFDRKKPIIAVEGLLDALTIGDQGTAYLGSSIKDEFIEKLLSLTDRNVIISVDNDDAGSETLYKIFKNSKHKKRTRVRYFIFSEKYKDCSDINELKIKHKIENIYDYVVNNSISDTKVRILKNIGESRK